ncbi:MAG: FAD-binding protein [Candidatus Riflebacteria bacterium]|nr:FAD-binding protein [Candidatus Riflebacteria bacterium]
MRHIDKMLESLSRELDGDLFLSESLRIAYATDASPYQETPLAVAIPRTFQDLKKLVKFADSNSVPLIPRAAGTSLAGQCTGSGIVVDISRHFTSILELNTQEKWVRVEPGVNRDELNLFLAPHGLFFGPETSTSKYCRMSGMVGNNACGAHSLIYGSTRDHTIELKCILSNGEEAHFKPLTNDEFDARCRESTLEGSLYRHIMTILSPKELRDEIYRESPKPGIKRRNTGYAVDLLLGSCVFTENSASHAPGDSLSAPFNFCKLLCGSEGTLAFITEIKLNLVDIPPKEIGLIVAHFSTLEEALEANLIALRYRPGAVELIDRTILDLAMQNKNQRENRFFIQGDPGAVLVIEFARTTRSEIENTAKAVEAEMRANGYGYHFPLIWFPRSEKVWTVRKAGLGLLSNIPGDKKPVSFIEDTAVSPEDLPAYIGEFKKIMEKYGLSCVYHAHIGSGELHLRPLLNLKDQRDVWIFHEVGREVALLVKRYRGSLSGEHGDGRLRGEFIPIMAGDRLYELFREIKRKWDPRGIFNPGKIVDTPPMNTSLRYAPDQETPDFRTVLDFDQDKGILRAAEKCNGSSDCRKTHLMGGAMCPSYMVTLDEKDTTRARANILRHYLTHSIEKNRFNHSEILEFMDLCVGCKACKSECPSSVDMASMKSEFLQQYYLSNGVPFRSWFVGHYNLFQQLGALSPVLTNFLFRFGPTGTIIKKILGFASKRALPRLSQVTFRDWCGKNLSACHAKLTIPFRSIILFCDEFTNFQDVEIGIAAVELFTRLNYRVSLTDHCESGRTFLSKGLLFKARRIAEKNIRKLSPIVCEETPLIGLEPSSILTFRDEYPRLVGFSLKGKAEKLRNTAFTFDEFLAGEIKSGMISSDLFNDEPRHIMVHGHCHQKSLASAQTLIDTLSIIPNSRVELIPSACCGMAGSFGYEKEHYDVSMRMGELSLFPRIREASSQTIISASGTSCRQQISDGTGRRAFHPLEVLLQSLKG